MLGGLLLGPGGGGGRRRSTAWPRLRRSRRCRDRDLHGRPLRRRHRRPRTRGRPHRLAQRAIRGRIAHQTWPAALDGGGRSGRNREPRVSDAALDCGPECAAAENMRPSGARPGWPSRLAISLLLGHAVTLTALALIVACTGSPMRTRGVPGTSWRVMLAVGAVGLRGGARALQRAASAPMNRAPPRLADRRAQRAAHPAGRDRWIRSRASSTGSRQRAGFPRSPKRSAARARLALNDAD